MSIEVVKKEKRNQKVGMNEEQNAKHAARATQVNRQVEKKADTHDTARHIEHRGRTHS